MLRVGNLSAAAGFALTLIATASAASAIDTPLAAGLPESEQRGIEAIAELPRELRDAALRTARHPEVLVRIPSWRADFDAHFAGLVFGRDAASKARLEGLAAHPDLVAALLVNEGAKLDQAIADYPGDLQQTARDARAHDRDALRSLNALHERQAERSRSALAALEPELRDAFERVLDEPGTSALLLDHLHAAETIAAAQQLDPGGTDTELDRISSELANERQRAAEARAARERAVLAKAARAEERRRWRAWRRHWGYSRWHHPYDVYYGRWCDPWSFGWHRRWRHCW